MLTKKSVNEKSVNESVNELDDDQAKTLDLIEPYP